jgi:hypothetical protein
MSENENRELLLQRFPPTKSKRAVYFDTLDVQLRELLVLRGYSPVLLMELPRGTDEHARLYLLALAQGMSEDTIEASKERLAACELEMKARKMLTAKELPPSRTKLEEDTETILASWTSSHHSGREPTPGQKPEQKLESKLETQSASEQAILDSTLGDGVALRYTRKPQS